MVLPGVTVLLHCVAFAVASSTMVAWTRFGCYTLISGYIPHKPIDTLAACNASFNLHVTKKSSGYQ